MMEPSMAQTAREIFIVGLRNAHAMETQARELMDFRFKCRNGAAHWHPTGAASLRGQCP
jgi:hypothetical protein